jgi:hypothetical protein
VDAVVTKNDYKVLKFLSSVRYAVPAEIGQAMGGTVSGKAQGLGRMGGRKALGNGMAAFGESCRHR